MSEEENTTTWKAALPEPLQDAPYFKNAESVDQVLADLTNAAQLQGNSLRIPGPDVEDYSEFHQKVMEKIPGLMKVPNTEDEKDIEMLYGKLGRPDVADNYRVPEIEGFDTEGIDLGTMKGRAFKNNLTQAQFEASYRQLAEDVMQGRTVSEHQRTEQLNALKEEWGDAYNQRQADIQTFLKLANNVPESLKAEAEAGRLSTDMMRFLHSISQLGGEDAPLSDQRNDRINEPTPGEAMEQLGELETKLFNSKPTDPEYPALMARRIELMKKAYPDARQNVDNLRA